MTANAVGVPFIFLKGEWDMRYVYTERNYEGIITVGEYVAATKQMKYLLLLM